MPNPILHLPQHEPDAAFNASATEIPVHRIEAARHLTNQAAEVANRPHEPYAMSPEDRERRLREIEELRLGKSSFKPEYRNLLLGLADPFGKYHTKRKEITKSLLKEQERKPVHEHFERDATREASEHADAYRTQLLGKLEQRARERSDKNLRKQLAEIENNPLYRGTRFAGLKQAAIDKARRKSVKHLEQNLTDAELKIFQDSLAAGLKERELASNMFARTEAQDFANRQERREALRLSEALKDRDRADKLRHIGILQQIGLADETREQSIKDIMHQEFQEARAHPERMLELYSTILRGLPPSVSMHHQIGRNAGTPYLGIQQALGNSLLGVGSQMFNRTPMGSYEHHAEGDLIGQALYNGVANHTSPYQALRDLSRQELMTGLLKNQASKRQQYATGGAISPILQGAQQASEFAQIKKNKLNEANRMRQMQHPSMGDSIFSGIASGLAHTPGWSHQGSIMGEAVAGRQARQASYERQREKASKLESEALKHEMEMHKANHQMLMDERRVKADERRAALEEKRFHKELERLGLERLKIEGKYGNGSIQLGTREVHPKMRIGKTPGTAAQSRDYEKTLKEIQSKKIPVENMLEFIEQKKKQNDLPMTGVIAEHTPDLSGKAQEYTRNLTSLIAGEMPSGIHTMGKQKFAEMQKPTLRTSVEDTEKYAKHKKKILEEMETPLLYARDYAAYGVPERTTISAYQAWEASGKPGEFEDFLVDILEGNKSISSRKHESIHHETSMPMQDMSKMSTDELLAIARG